MGEDSTASQLSRVSLRVVQRNGKNGLASTVVIPEGIRYQFVGDLVLSTSVRCWQALDPLRPTEKGNLVVSRFGTEVMCHERQISLNIGDEFYRNFGIVPADPRAALPKGLKFVV